MNYVPCPSGHLYDQSQYTSCPYCANGQNSIDFTVGLNNNQMMQPEYQNNNMLPIAELNVTTPIDNNYSDPAAMLNVTAPYEDVDIGKTISFDENENMSTGKVELVRGWLVCTEGEKRGMCFNIYNQNNYVGRDPTCTVCLDFDKGISREPSFVIAYDSTNNLFYIAPTLSGAKATVYLNSIPLLSQHELKDYDLIKLANTSLSFRSFCSESFKW